MSEECSEFCITEITIPTSLSRVTGGKVICGIFCYHLVSCHDQLHSFPFFPILGMECNLSKVPLGVSILPLFVSTIINKSKEYVSLSKMLRLLIPSWHVTPFPFWKVSSKLRRDILFLMCTTTALHSTSSSQTRAVLSSLR